MIYCDTAYIARLYLAEPGFAEVRSLVSTEGRVACSVHGRVETAYVFHRKLREGSIDSAHFEARMRQFDLDCTANLFHWIPLINEIAASATATVRLLSPTTFLRAADALHLACARDNGFKEIYSNDQRLLSAAPLFGLKGMNVIK